MSYTIHDTSFIRSSILSLILFSWTKWIPSVPSGETPNCNSDSGFLTLPPSFHLSYHILVEPVFLVDTFQETETLPGIVQEPWLPCSHTDLVSSTPPTPYVNLTSLSVLDLVYWNIRNHFSTLKYLRKMTYVTLLWSPKIQDTHTYTHMETLLYTTTSRFTGLLNPPQFPPLSIWRISSGPKFNTDEYDSNTVTLAPSPRFRSI